MEWAHGGRCLIGVSLTLKVVSVNAFVSRGEHGLCGGGEPLSAVGARE
jgi:hypothetical protein